VINRKQTATGVRVTFSLDEPRPTSVIGDFNDWNPRADPMIERSNGLRSFAREFPAGSEIRFRYVTDDIRYIDDPDADRTEPNPFGSSDNVVVATATLEGRT
jgi:1,4-alpha-glucan branching enzyme